MLADSDQSRQVLLNLTEDQRKIEQALRDSENQLATLISNLPGFVYRCANDRDWTMLFMSDGCRDITGYAPEDFLQNKRLAFNDLVPSRIPGTALAEVASACSREKALRGGISDPHRRRRNTLGVGARTGHLFRNRRIAVSGRIRHGRDGT